MGLFGVRFLTFKGAKWQVLDVERLDNARDYSVTVIPIGQNGGEAR